MQVHYVCSKQRRTFNIKAASKYDLDKVTTCIFGFYCNQMLSSTHSIKSIEIRLCGYESFIET